MTIKPKNCQEVIAINNQESPTSEDLHILTSGELKKYAFSIGELLEGHLYLGKAPNFNVQIKQNVPENSLRLLRSPAIPLPFNYSYEPLRVSYITKQAWSHHLELPHLIQMAPSLNLKHRIHKVFSSFFKESEKMYQNRKLALRAMSPEYKSAFGLVITLHQANPEDQIPLAFELILQDLKEGAHARALEYVEILMGSESVKNKTLLFAFRSIAKSMQLGTHSDDFGWEKVYADASKALSELSSLKNVPSDFPVYLLNIKRNAMRNMQEHPEVYYRELLKTSYHLEMTPLRRLSYLLIFADKHLFRKTSSPADYIFVEKYLNRHLHCLLSTVQSVVTECPGKHLSAESYFEALKGSSSGISDFHLIFALRDLLERLANFRLELNESESYTLLRKSQGRILKPWHQYQDLWLPKADFDLLDLEAFRNRSLVYYLGAIHLIENHLQSQPHLSKDLKISLLKRIEETYAFIFERYKLSKELEIILRKRLSSVKELL